MPSKASKMEPKVYPIFISYIGRSWEVLSPLPTIELLPTFPLPVELGKRTRKKKNRRKQLTDFLLFLRIVVYTMIETKNGVTRTKATHRTKGRGRGLERLVLQQQTLKVSMNTNPILRIKVLRRYGITLPNLDLKDKR